MSGVACPKCGSRSLRLLYSMPVDVHVIDGTACGVKVHDHVLEYDNQAVCAVCGPFRLWWAELNDMRGNDPGWRL